MSQNNYYTPYAQQYPNYGVQQQAMPMYNRQPMKTPDYTNPLGAEKIKELLSKGQNMAPKINITEEDFNEAICTHRFEGKQQLIELPDGRVKCKICGAEFTPVDSATQEDVEAATRNLLNIFHTAKIAWLDMPDKVGMDLFQSIAVIKKTPELFKIAMQNYASYNGYNIQNMNNPVNGFNIMNQILGPNAPFYGQQQYQYPPYQAPQYQQQVQYDHYGNPMNVNNYNPAAQQMQASAPGVSNQFGYTAPPKQEQNNTAGQGAKGETVTKTLHQ